MDVPFIDFKASVLSTHEAAIEAIDQAATRGQLILGQELQAFESEFATFCDARHCVGVANGLEALSLSLRALGIGPGDEVIVPSQTFVATWLAVSHVGATPVEVDIDAETSLISVRGLEEAITGRTRAIIPVHLYGQVADMASIMRIASARGLYVLEDAAQAHGARFEGRRTGSLGHVAAFSFYPTKNLGAYGDGGAVVTNDSQLNDKLRRLRNYGSEQKYQHLDVGYNSRLDEVQAAVLRVRLPHLEAENDLRRAAAEFYLRELEGAPGLRLPNLGTASSHVFHLFVVHLRNRDAVLDHLKASGVHAAVHYPKIPGDQPAYGFKLDRRTATIGQVAARECLSLPMWPQITRAQQKTVVDALLSAIERTG